MAKATKMTMEERDAKLAELKGQIAALKAQVRELKETPVAKPTKAAKAEEA